ncbi:superoxide dismutase[Cu-Zn] [Mycobacterium parmense]|uniref:Superoxide dismutase [Cu-Zn] n=1 Tax=Mycobacterium parmense TaxID=185642 RepID=A0A7I7YW78_9MYCO|nr:superoxide dismutase family protein [Mycobacterium parmense]MCV7350515.1 superoxide dismutase family protein [Mycobacterium parmense]ORW48239.1 superoxide dismutase [Mycobacterium parmense]BBZ46060.1 superoxide dismutase [Cu-Zn] [Mycobacterium parmense]
MPKLPGSRNAAVAAVALSALVGAALATACSSPQHAATTQGTPPPIWTGSPAPSQMAKAQAAPGDSSIIATHLKAPDGTEVATAQFAFNNGYATITIETTANNMLAPGLHDVHVHKVGKCEPNSVDPAGGAPGDFLSAGGHFQAPGHNSEPASGDLPALAVRKGGAGMLVTTTDAFGMDDLLTGEKTAIIIHAGAEGAGGMAGMGMNNADVGKRVACGVIGSG